MLPTLSRLRRVPERLGLPGDSVKIRLGTDILRRVSDQLVPRLLALLWWLRDKSSGKSGENSLLVTVAASPSMERLCCGEFKGE